MAWRIVQAPSRMVFFLINFFVIFFWNYLCCLWLGSEELDLLPEKPAICDSVDPFIVCSFEVLNSSLVDYQDLSQG
jgi:hypothetical protein